MDSRFLAKVKRRDKWARWLIVSGGIGIIASMMVMIIFMVKVTLPLFSESSRELLRRIHYPELPVPLLFDTDPYLENGFAIDKTGTLTVFELRENGKIISTHSLRPPRLQVESGVAESQESDGEVVELIRAEKYGKEHYALYWSNGGVSQIHSEFKIDFDRQTNARRLKHHVEELGSITPQGMVDGNALSRMRVAEDGSLAYARLLDGSSVYVYKVSRTEDLFGDVTEQTAEATVTIPGENAIVDVRLTANGRWLYLGTSVGTLLLYDLEDLSNPVLIDHVQATAQGESISAMNFPFGESSLAVGDQAGKLAIWSLIRYKDGPKLRQLHQYDLHQEPIAKIRPSIKDKSLVSMDQSGNLELVHMTSGRHLMSLEPALDILDFSVSERFDALLIRDSKNVMWLWGLDIPHPEISWQTLWGKVWYEGYPEPDYVWQSSSATDDFEPKLSLMPLLFGSLKGTFYGMLFSLPLALLCAMYVSHLMEPKWRVVVKPVVELMAAVPTVVIGFLAALWLAPKLEANLLAVVFSLVTIPLFVFAAMWFFIKRKRKLGAEFLVAIPFIIAAFFLAYQLGLIIQNTVFGGNLNLWLFQQLGLSVDQRNCVVISFALGFAVIPIIFTISEDALYNVPKHLTAAALALGSSRWQTLRRVVLPMASPGIFAATMIGFGRAVGETMIVLMATGNTPIMSPSILNGMRTLSANIAVEIPEAPVGSTLYRLLFLSAVLLFLLTFVVNTAAELVRHRLQQKYKNL